MQNKANFRNNKMNITLYITNDYENKSGLLTMAKQTQTKPIPGVPLKKNGAYYGPITSTLLMKLKNQCKLFGKKMSSEKSDEEIMGKCRSI